jgi:hypothetical protein
VKYIAAAIVTAAICVCDLLTDVLAPHQHNTWRWYSTAAIVITLGLILFGKDDE